MTINNKYIGAILDFLYRHKVRKLSFTYEQTLVDDEVLDKAYVRQYISALEEAVEQEIATLTKEFEL